MLYFLLILVLFIEYVAPGEFEAFAFIKDAKLNTVIPLLVFLFSVFVRSRTSIEEIFKHSNTKLFLYLFFLVSLSWPIMGGVSSAEIWRGVLGYSLLYFSICRLADSKEKLKGVFLILGISHIVIIVLNPDLILHPETRSYLTTAPFLGDGNDFGLSLCIVFPLTVYLFLDTKNKIRKTLFLAISVIMVLAIVGTQSRGASLGIGGSLFYLWWRSNKKMLGVFALGILVFIVLLFAAPQYFARMSSIASYQTEGSAQGRIFSWKQGMYMAGMYPLTGVGTGNFGYYNQYKTAHSIYFLALGELGIPGAIFIILYMFKNFGQLKFRLLYFGENLEEWEQSYKKLFIYLTASLLGLAIAGAFLSVLYYPHIFIVAAMLVAAQRIYEKEKESRLSTDEQDVKKESSFTSR